MNSLETTRSDSITGRWEENFRPIYYGAVCARHFGKGGSVFLTRCGVYTALKASDPRDPVWEMRRGNISLYASDNIGLLFMMQGGSLNIGGITNIKGSIVSDPNYGAGPVSAHLEAQQTKR